MFALAQAYGLSILVRYNILIQVLIFPLTLLYS